MNWVWDTRYVRGQARVQARDRAFVLRASFKCIVNFTCNKLLLLFARPRLLASRGCRVTVFPNCVPLLGFTFGRFHDTGRGLGAAGDSGARPLHFWLGRALIARSRSQLRNFALARIGVWAMATILGCLRSRSKLHEMNRFGFSLKFCHRRGERFIFFNLKTGRLDGKYVGMGFKGFLCRVLIDWLIA